MIDPREVLIAVPCYGGEMTAQTAGGLVSVQGLYSALVTPDVSHPGVARNTIADGFLRSNFNWLVCVDNDIAFTRRDFELLMQPIDPEQTDLAGPLPTRIELPLVKIPDPAHRIEGAFARLDFNVKEPAPADVLVSAEYSYKNDSGEPVKLGFGFVRIHRSVFRTLEKLTHDASEPVQVRRELYETLLECIPYDAQTGGSLQGMTSVPISLLQKLRDTTDDPKGTPRLWQMSLKGSVFFDYFPSGPLLSQMVVNSEWKGEDHGFFTLCYLAGLVPRIETRTRLVHYGRKGYEYLGPDQGGGQ